MAAIEVELKALEITQMRVVSNATRLPKGAQDPASSVLKLKGSELQQAATEILIREGGIYPAASDAQSSPALAKPPDFFAPEGVVEEDDEFRLGFQFVAQRFERGLGRQVALKLHHRGSSHDRLQREAIAMARTILTTSPTASRSRV